MSARNQVRLFLCWPQASRVPWRNVARAVFACALGGAWITVAMPPAWAQDGFIAKTETYTDSDNTTVVRPSVSVVKQLGWNVQAGGAYSVDIITTGSVDVVTQATQPEFQDRRQETEGNLTYLGASGLKLGGSFAYSTEADYKSKATSFTFARDFFERSTTISGRLGYVHDDVLHVVDPTFDQDLDGFGYTGSAALVVSRGASCGAPATRARPSRVHAEPRIARGASAISTATWEMACRTSTGSTATRPTSATPTIGYGTRSSRAARGIWASRQSIHPQYTFYFDDWGVSSHRA